MRTPLHIKPSDTSADADLARIALYQHNFALTGGKGFRNPCPRMEAIGARSFAK